MDRKVFKISTTQAAKDAITRYSEDNDMTQEGVASRVYNWFGSLPNNLKHAIIFPDSHEGMRLREIIDHAGVTPPARQPGSGVHPGDGTPDQALPVGLPGMGMPTREPTQEERDDAARMVAAARRRAAQQTRETRKTRPA